MVDPISLVVVDRSQRLLCAWLSSRFASTLEKNILLSFFIALVLALGKVLPSNR